MFFEPPYCPYVKHNFRSKLLSSQTWINNSNFKHRILILYLQLLIFCKYVSFFYNDWIRTSILICTLRLKISWLFAHWNQTFTYRYSGDGQWCFFSCMMPQHNLHNMYHVWKLEHNANGLILRLFRASLPTLYSQIRIQMSGPEIS